MKTAEITVVIPAYNQAPFLAQAIDSALAQTLPPAEVVVVDDGSTDATPRVLERFAGRVTVVSQANRGVAAARNVGARRSSGAFLAFLDADDFWLPRKLECQYLRFGADPTVGLVHCGYREVNRGGDNLGENLQGAEGWLAREMLLLRRPTILGGGSGALMRRQVFEAVGGFDVLLSTSADWDLYYRICRRWKVAFVPEVLLCYRLHAGNMHKDVRAFERDMFAALNKAFAERDPRLRPIRRKSYGILHTVLAGCYFNAGAYRDFLSHSLTGILLSPDNVLYHLKYPWRLWQRRRAAQNHRTHN